MPSAHDGSRTSRRRKLDHGLANKYCSSGGSPTVITAIAIVATIKRIIVQMIVASRVVYGLADRRLLPPLLARINALTQTPLEATALVIVAVLLLAVALHWKALPSGLRG